MQSDDIAPFRKPAASSDGLAARPSLPDIWEDALGPELERLWLRAKELRYWLLALFAAALIAAVALTLLQPRQYRSAALVEISRIDTAAASDVEGAVVPIEERDEQYYETQYELLKSRFLAERVVDAKNLTRDKGFRAALGAGDDDVVSKRKAAEFLLAGITINPVPKSNLVEISISSTSSDLAAALANAWAREFLRANYEKRFGDTTLAREQVDKQLDEMRAKLEKSEADLIRYANAHQIVILQRDKDGESARSTLIASQLDALSSALAAATTRRIAAESGMRAGNDMSSIVDMAALRARLADARASLASLRSKLGRDNIRVRERQSEVASLEQSLTGEGRAQTSARDAEYRKASMEERALQARFEATKREYLTQQGEGVQYGILQRDVDTNRQIYDALLQRHKQLGVANSSANNMTLIQGALPAGAPYKPSLFMNIMIALAVAALISGVVVYGAETLDTSIRDPEDMRRRFGLPLIGMIPWVDSPTILAEITDQHSVLAEAYASVRVSVQYAEDDRPLKSVMLTSTRSDEGKTVSSLALASSFARVGEKTLLIDLDLRRAGLTKVLARDAGTGMVALLASTTNSPHIQRLEDFGIDFIASGPPADNPVTLLAGNRLHAFIEQMKRQYDRIIVDGPPVLGLADAPEMSRAVDGLIYVVQANAGSRHAIRRAISRLAFSKAILVGGVVTQIDARNPSYDYGYDYGRGRAEPRRT